MKSNIDLLRNLLNEHLESDSDEFGLLDDIETEVKELQKDLKSAEESLDESKSEVSDLQDEVKDLESKLEDEPEYENSIDLGLDTIHFTFEKDNLLIRQQFDSLMQVLCKTPNAVI